MARKKVTSVPALADWGAVDNALRDIRECQHTLAEMAVQRDRQIDSIKADYAQGALPLQNRVKALESEVKAYVDLHRAELDGKLDSAATKAELEKEVGECKQQIAEIQHTYTTRSQHQQDWTECHNDIKSIQRNFLTKEDYFREQAKTEKKLDQILNLLMKGRLSDE